jgi:hypothetical protein
VQRDAVRRLERAGYQSVWNNEGVGGKDGLVQLGVLLAATERMAFGSAIANIWARPPQTAHGAAVLLADAYPGRFVLGLGVGYPFQAVQIGRDYGRPLATIRDYFEQMTAEQPLAQVPELSYPASWRPTARKCSHWRTRSPTGRCPSLCRRSTWRTRAGSWAQTRSSSSG